MRVVVTGASGSVGTAFLRTVARDSGWTVLGVVRRPPRSNQSPYDRAEWMACDIGCPDAAARLSSGCAGADAVVHLAWAIQPSTDEASLHRTNIEGTRAVLQAVAAERVPHLIVASSVAVYTPTPDRWERVGEDAPRDGIRSSAYSRDKVAVEKILDAFADQYPQIRVNRIRPCAIVQYDAGGQISRRTMSPLLPRALIGRNRVPLPLWQEVRGQIVHADDVAEAIRLILGREVPGSFNLASEPVLTAEEVARTLAGFHLPVPRRLLAGAAWPTWRLGVQPIHPGWLALIDQAALVSTDRARQVLGWRPAHHAATALAEMARGLREGAGTASDALAPDHRGVVQRIASLRPGRPVRQAQR